MIQKSNFRVQGMYSRIYATIFIIENLHYKFQKMGGAGRRLFGIFPKIHPIWWSDPSLNTDGSREQMWRQLETNQLKAIGACGHQHNLFVDSSLYLFGLINMFYWVGEKPGILSFIHSLKSTINRRDDMEFIQGC